MNLLLTLTQSANKLRQTKLVTNTLKALNLGNSASFAILTKTGVTDVSPSSVVGNVGAYPITGAAILLTCPEIVGTVYQVDAAGAACFVTNASHLLSSIGDMEIAYTAANLLANPDFIEYGAGDISGATLTPGLYKWSSSVLINADFYLCGTPNDVFIFTIAGNINQAANTKLTLLGGVKTSNIFWVVQGASVDIQAGAVLQGTILAKGGINLITGAKVYGRLLAQTAVTLQMNTIVIPSNKKYTT